MRCLIIKNDGIGDLVLSSGIIASISSHLGAQVDLVTCEANRQIAEMIPGVGETYYVSRDRLGLVNAWNTSMPVVDNKLDRETLKRLSSTTYDIAIVLRRFIRQSTLVLMQHVVADQKCCFWEIVTNASQRQAEQFSLDWNRLQPNEYHINEADYYADLVRQIFSGITISPPELKPPADIRCVDFPTTRSNTVAIGIGGSSVKLGSNFWIAVVQSFLEAEWNIYIFGGPDDRELGEYLSTFDPRVVNVVGEGTLQENFVQLASFDFYLGNDTGLSHMATLACKKVVVAMGGGTFKRFFPWPDSVNQFVTYHELPCYDCGWNCHFDERLCVASLNPQRVANYANEVFKGRATDRMYNLNQSALEVATDFPTNSLQTGAECLPPSTKLSLLVEKVGLKYLIIKCRTVLKLWTSDRMKD